MFVKRPKSNIFLYLCNIIMAENQLDFATLKNVVLLHSKRTRFASQKDSFYTPKGLLLRGKRTPFEKLWCNVLIFKQ